MKHGLMFGMVIGASMALTPVTLAQSPQKAPDTAEKTAPETQKPKTDKAPKPKTAGDLDAFFEEGERQSEDGPTCRKPEPIA